MGTLALPAPLLRRSCGIPRVAPLLLHGGELEGPLLEPAHGMPHAHAELHRRARAGSAEGPAYDRRTRACGE
eukprot:15453297-Alexandrium_andersonii.AAC.1